MTDDNNQPDSERAYADHLLIKLAARKAQDGDGELAQYLRDCVDQRNRLRNLCEVMLRPYFRQMKMDATVREIDRALGVGPGNAEEDAQ